jgi:hypothetical protein
VRPVGGSPPAFEGAPVPEECRQSDESPGTHPGRLLREARRVGLRPGRRLRRVLIGSRSESSELGRYCRRESPRAGPGGKPHESLRGREIPRARMSGKSLERRVCSTFGSGVRKAQEGRGREADPTAFGTCSEEAPRNPREHRPGRASARAGTDPLREQSLGAAGHRDLLVLRAEERDVRNSKRATAPKGVRTCGGGKL